MKIPQDKISQIHDAIPIEELIGSYIPLKRVGKNFKSLCPFHSERTPSFFISPEKGLYHCFGCGKSGNIFTFMMEYNNLTFPQAIRFLGEKAGIHVESVEDVNENLYKANEFAARLYHSSLFSDNGLPGRKWLEYRGIQRDIVDKFMIGYAPSDSIVYLNSSSKGINLADLETLGLLVKLEGGGYRDTFSMKVIFPIRDRWGKVLGFGTRVLDNSEPKYINSRDSPVFKKGNLLYGLYESQPYIKEEVILVEGYTDLLTLYQSGIKNVVASLGTSLTAYQARLLKLHASSVILIYDGDIEGLKAAERAIDILLETSLNVKILPLSEGEDPDSFVRKYGKLDLSGAQSFVEFKFKECKDVYEKGVLVRSFQQTLSKISDAQKRELWADYISQKLGVNRNFLLVVPTSSPYVKPAVSKMELEGLEIELLALASSYPIVKELLLKNQFEFSTPELSSLFDLVLKGMKPSEILNSVSECLRTSFTKVIFLEGVDSKKMAFDYINRITRWKADLRKIELREIGDKEGWTPEHLAEYQKLTTKLKGG